VCRCFFWAGGSICLGVVVLGFGRVQLGWGSVVCLRVLLEMGMVRYIGICIALHSFAF
jgi:hypothetical protein